MTSKKKVSIIILAKNSCNRIEDVMKSLHNQIFTDEVEVIAIDSGSTDGTLDIFQKYGAKIYNISPEEFHHSKTRNLGAEIASGNLLVFLTSDAVPVHEKWLINLINPFNKKEIGATYGRQIAYPETKKTEKFFYNYFYPNKAKILKKEDIKNIRKFYLENVFISNVNAAIRKDVWEKIKFNNEIINHEDKDFALKLLKCGHKIYYEPGASVYHSHNYNLWAVFKRRFNDGAAFTSIVDQGKNNFFYKGIIYFIEEMKFFIFKKDIIWIPYAIIYDFLYFLGFQLGSKEKYLPKFIKNKLIYKYA